MKFLCEQRKRIQNGELKIKRERINKNELNCVEQRKLCSRPQKKYIINLLFFFLFNKFASLSAFVYVKVIFYFAQILCVFFPCLFGLLFCFTLNLFAQNSTLFFLARYVYRCINFKTFVCQNWIKSFLCFNSSTYFLLSRRVEFEKVQSVLCAFVVNSIQCSFIEYDFHMNDS